MRPNIIAIVQARMGSSRLPGKVMIPLHGMSVLAHVITRVQTCDLLDALVVATTRLDRDDVIVAEARKFGAGIYRGSESDVLSRYYKAATQWSADVVVRITSDCPLIDPELLKKMIQRFITLNSARPGVDYLSNTLERTFPRGLDVEIFTMAALERAWRQADQPYQREHVTPYIYLHPDQFRLVSHTDFPDTSHHRWTLDTPEDLALIRRIYDELYHPHCIITTQQVMELMADQPELAEINAHVEQKPLITT